MCGSVNKFCGQVHHYLITSLLLRYCMHYVWITSECFEADADYNS